MIMYSFRSHPYSKCATSAPGEPDHEIITHAFGTPLMHWADLTVIYATLPDYENSVVSASVSQEQILFFTLLFFKWSDINL